jgi:uncharacterized membrane protein YhaH (DUF805 family)
MELMFQPFRKYFDFTGRARRSEYWLFELLIILVIVTSEGAAAIGEYQHLPPLQYAGAAVVTIFVLFAIIPSLSVQFRRLHDINKSAWWILFGMIPLVGSIVLLIFFLTDGTPGHNRFGSDPKGRGISESPEVLAFS